MANFVKQKRLLEVRFGFNYGDRFLMDMYSSLYWFLRFVVKVYGAYFLSHVVFWEHAYEVVD